MAEAMSARERNLVVELERLQALLDEPVQTIEAIRKGQVDAFVVSETDEDRVYVLKSADHLYRLIVEAMGEGAVTLSDDGTVAYCNPQFLQLAATERQEVLGRPMRQFLTDETRPMFEALLKNTGPSTVRAEIALDTKNGPVPVSAVCSRIRDSHAPSFCVILNDLRDQRDREQLRAAKDAAEQANRAKDDFLAMVSHELRSPITVILGWTRMLQMNRVDAETRSVAIDNIHHSTARLHKLVEEILDASRLSGGKATLELGVLDLRDSVQASIGAVRFEIDQKPLRVAVRMPDEPVLVLGDSDRLQQIVLNVLTNAIKFTPPHAEIDIQLEVRDGLAWLHVRDTGEGISPEFLPFIFERFRQDDSSTTRAHRGLGLGLAIVKQLLDAHGGSVTASSEGKGKGATFTISLPLTDHSPETAVRSQQEPLPSLQAIRVLVVDDEADTLEVFRSILVSAGAVVEVATSVAQALACAAGFQPHVIVSDIAMPGEDGLQFLRRLSLHAPQQSAVPVLAMTGKSKPGDRDAILAAGFRSYLQKPIEPEALIRAVHELRKSGSG